MIFFFDKYMFKLIQKILNIHFFVTFINIYFSNFKIISCILFSDKTLKAKLLH